MSDNFSTKLSFYKEKVVISTVIFLCLLLSVTFPVSDSIQSISRSIFFLIILPILYIKLISKETLSSWGWIKPNKISGLFLSLILLALGSVLFFLLIRFVGFSSHYQVPLFAKNSFADFLLYELFFLNVYFFSQEVFFKSFVLFAFKQFSAWAVLIQSGLYLLVLLISKDLSWQTTPFIFISLAGGWLTYKTKSFFYSYFFGLLFIITLDAYIISLAK